MRIVDLIEKKKRGEEFSTAEIDFIVKGALDQTIQDYQLSALFMAIYFKGMTDKETTALTLAMADSGDKIDPLLFTPPAVDKHSSGGVGDSTTLVIAPVVASLGIPVAKLSGRGLGFTGGTIDKLESIKGLNTELSMDKFIRQVNKIKLAISSQSLNMCPADKLFYALRDITATVDSIPLIASSIMSKKIAGGASCLVLDVKCGEGAFMKDLESATKLSELMVKIGKLAKRRTSVFITDMSEPLDNFIGNNLELYGGLMVLLGEKNRLYTLSKALGAEMLRLSGVINPEQAFDEAITSGKALLKLKEMIKAEGGSPLVIDNPSLLLNAPFIKDITAKEGGVVSKIIPTEIGLTVCKLGGGRIKKTDVIDEKVGIELKVEVGSKVNSGDVLAKMYYSKIEDELYAENILNSITVSNNAKKAELILKKILA